MSDLVVIEITERDSILRRIDELEAKNARLREALTNLIAACDEGRMVARSGGAGGMTIENQIRGSVINGVPAWPVEEAREALEESY